MTQPSPQSSTEPSAEDLERERALLRERAAQLGAPHPEVETGPHIEVLRFTLAQEQYALEIEYIDEVIPFEYITRIPCTPAHVLGAVSHRGRVLAIVDLKRFFGLPERGLVNLNRVIVVRDDQMEYGLLADVVLGVERIAEATIRAAPVTLAGLGKDALRGIGPDALVILDGHSLLTDPRMVVNEDVKA